MFRAFAVENWNRRDAYHFFLPYEDPFFNISATIDITFLADYCRENDFSFNLTLLFFTTQTANEITEFRLRLHEGQPVLYDRIHCGSPVLHEDHHFSFCYVQEFNGAGKLLIQQQLQGGGFDARVNDRAIIHYTVIPWTSFTAIKHAKRFKTDDAIPKISLGKYFTENGRVRLPISVEVSHVMMDGYHVGRYLEILQAKMDALKPAALAEKP
jgi:chloramphenicol O-acetyltransferase type A